ncbi:hypothetical protein HPB50_022198 [Hyalomma asiaticum]|uniref:Uncharacterized protein n=1 Tax=Hyalomma asiaticum TaxID=266040 RepID=A0ACB7TBI9_HYAAI|nr:hypothetical protein HPB50_022198 [Hyalomma asiaticum]
MHPQRSFGAEQYQPPPVSTGAGCVKPISAPATPKAPIQCLTNEAELPGLTVADRISPAPHVHHSMGVTKIKRGEKKEVHFVPSKPSAYNLEHVRSVYRPHTQGHREKGHAQKVSSSCTHIILVSTLGNGGVDRRDGVSSELHHCLSSSPRCLDDVREGKPTERNRRPAPPRLSTSSPIDARRRRRRPSFPSPSGKTMRARVLDGDHILLATRTGELKGTKTNRRGSVCSSDVPFFAKMPLVASGKPPWKNCQENCNLIAVSRGQSEISY